MTRRFRTDLTILNNIFLVIRPDIDFMEFLCLLFFQLTIGLYSFIHFDSQVTLGIVAVVQFYVRCRIGVILAPPFKQHNSCIWSLARVLFISSTGATSPNAASESHNELLEFALQTHC